MTEQKLSATGSEIRTEIALVDPNTIAATPGESPELEKEADRFVEALLTTKKDDPDRLNQVRATAESLALETQKAAARQSEMLKQPIRTLAARSQDGGEVANALVELKVQVEHLNPNVIDTQPGFLTRMVGALPGVGTPLKRYFTKFESAQTVVASIIRALEQGRDQLKRDNTTLAEDQKRMRDLSKRLEQSIKLGQIIDQKLDYTLQRDIPADDPRHAFVRDELLFVVRQRIMDLQQQLAVNLQGVLATEIIIRNNKELVRGVDRALTVTVSALQVAVTVALALANQKIVLDKIQAVNATTASLIAQTAQKLRTQGVEIQKQAATTSIDMNVLKQAFTDLNGALEDITTFKQQALPAMSKAIGELSSLSQVSEAAVKKIESARTAEPLLALEPGEAKK